MNRFPASRDDVVRPALPLNVALFGGDINVAIVMQLANLTLIDAKRSIAGWVRSGVVSEPRSRNEQPRVRNTSREAALATSTPRQRRRAYEEIARALDESDASESDMLEIARYYRGGAQYRLAIARYLNVAEQQLERGDRENAGAVLAEAATSVPAHGPEMLAVLDLQAQCAMEAGDIPCAMSVLERLRRRAAVCGDRAAIVRALLHCAECRLLSDSPDTAIGFASRAIEFCSAFDESSPQTLSATLIIAQALCEQGNVAQAQARWQTAEVLGAAREPALCARYYYVAGELRRAARDPVAAAVEFRAALVAASTEHDVTGVLRATRALAAAQVQSADLFSAASTLRSALQVARRQRLPAAIADIARDLAHALIEAGRFADALRLIPADGTPANDALRLRIALHVNDRESIERCSSPDGIEDAFASSNQHRIARAVPVFAAVERYRLDVAAAHALYRRAIETMRTAAAGAPPDFWCDAAQYCAGADLGAVRFALNQARVGAPPLDALIIELGSIALDARLDATGVDIITRADAVAVAFLTGGFKTWSRRAQAIAVRMTPADRARDVISLIGSGCSNGEIAAQLYVSKRTVEKAIGDLLKAHGVRSRWQLVGIGDRIHGEFAERAVSERRTHQSRACRNLPTP